ncbi:transposable element Tcb2 transposase [Trichonephila clavipes]|nr:transposable element Tcb2 transposase [Trichonephila clavipes]
MQQIPGVIFQQDNAWPHTVRVSQNCLCTVTNLPWPARSPDLSTIEHIWDRLGWRVEHPPSLNELEARLQQIWNEMSQDIIQNLYMPQCPIVSHRAFMLEGVQQGETSQSNDSVLLPQVSELVENQLHYYI